MGSVKSVIWSLAGVLALQGLALGQPAAVPPPGVWAGIVHGTEGDGRLRLFGPHPETSRSLFLVDWKGDSGSFTLSDGCVVHVFIEEPGTFNWVNAGPPCSESLELSDIQFSDFKEVTTLLDSQGAHYETGPSIQVSYLLQASSDDPVWNYSGLLTPQVGQTSHDDLNLDAVWDVSYAWLRVELTGDLHQPPLSEDGWPCVIPNPAHPQTVTHWTGACVDGKISGFGNLDTYVDGILHHRNWVEEGSGMEAIDGHIRYGFLPDSRNIFFDCRIREDGSAFVVMMALNRAAFHEYRVARLTLALGAAYFEESSCSAATGEADITLIMGSSASDTVTGRYVRSSRAIQRIDNSVRLSSSRRSEFDNDVAESVESAGRLVEASLPFMPWERYLAIADRYGATNHVGEDCSFFFNPFIFEHEVVSVRLYFDRMRSRSTAMMKSPTCLTGSAVLHEVPATLFSSVNTPALVFGRVEGLDGGAASLTYLHAEICGNDSCEEFLDW